MSSLRSSHGSTYNSLVENAHFFPFYFKMTISFLTGYVTSLWASRKQSLVANAYFSLVGAKMAFHSHFGNRDLIAFSFWVSDVIPGHAIGNIFWLQMLICAGLRKDGNFIAILEIGI